MYKVILVEEELELHFDMIQECNHFLDVMAKVGWVGHYKMFHKSIEIRSGIVLRMWGD